MPTNAKFNQMANNDQYLYENLVRARYATSGLRRDTGIRILTGRIAVPASNTRWVRRDIYFDGFFSNGCSPTVQLTVVSAQQKQFMTVAQGIGGAELPDYRGMMVQIECEEEETSSRNLIVTNIFLDWLAMGY